MHVLDLVGEDGPRLTEAAHLLLRRPPLRCGCQRQLVGLDACLGDDAGCVAARLLPDATARLLGGGEDLGGLLAELAEEGCGVVGAYRGPSGGLGGECFRFGSVHLTKRNRRHRRGPVFQA